MAYRYFSDNLSKKISENISTRIRVFIDWGNHAKTHSTVCPELNYITSRRDTKEKEEAIENIKDALKLIFTSLPEHIITNKDSYESIEVLL